MHKFITGIFNFLKNLVYFFRIVTFFCILMLLLFWIQNLTKGNWEWLGFIKPFLNFLLETANSIYPLTFDFFGTVFEFKYISATILLLVAALIFRGLEFGIGFVEGLYNSGRFLCRKVEENVFNKQMQSKIEQTQKAITSYSIVVTTYEKAKNPYDTTVVNMQEQNSIMNRFIMEKLNVTPKSFENGFIYKFDSFDNIDDVLDIFFRVINSKAPINYSICININTNNPSKDSEILKKLSQLKYTGKIYMSAETAFRYDFNAIKKYETEQIGVYQYNKSTIDVYEFKPIL